MSYTNTLLAVQLCISVEYNLGRSPLYGPSEDVQCLINFFRDNSVPNKVLVTCMSMCMKLRAQENRLQVRILDLIRMLSMSQFYDISIEALFSLEDGELGIPLHSVEQKTQEETAAERSQHLVRVAEDCKIIVKYMYL